MGSEMCIRDRAMGDGAGQATSHRWPGPQAGSGFMFDSVLLALDNLLTVNSMGFLVMGTCIGLVFGAIPGLGGTTAIALLIPLTFGMKEFEAITLMGGVMAATSTGGSVSAILLNTPGTAPNAATTFDGYPLAQQGKAGLALGAAATASALGGLIGVITLVAVIPLFQSEAAADPRCVTLGCSRLI